MSAPSSLANTIANSQYAVKQQAIGVAGNSTANNKLNMQSFLVLLTKELANQDPTKPMDDSSFFTQMSQINQAEGMDNLNNDSQVQLAQSLMGQVVTATNPSVTGAAVEPTITGTVGRLTMKNGVYYLGIQDANGKFTDVTMDQVQSVVPGSSMTNPSSFIGKYISGPSATDATKSVAGQVIGLTSQSGKILLEVRDSNGKTATVDPTEVSNVASS